MMRCVRARFSLSTKKRGRKGYIAKTVFKLVKYMFYRLKRLTHKRGRQYASRRLQINIKYRYPLSPLPTRGLSATSVLKTFKRTIPLAHPADANFIFIEFWHQLSRKALLLQIIQTCKNIPRRIFARAQYISFEASDFIRCHLRDWILEPPVLVDDKDENECRGPDFGPSTSSATESITDFSRDYIPNTYSIYDTSIFEPSNFIDSDSDFIYGKIPLKKTRASSPMRKTLIKQNIKKSKIPDSVVFHKRLKGDKKDDAKLRQTKIEEFFKPRRTSIYIGATSRGAMKNHSSV